MRSLETLSPGDLAGIIRRRIWYFLITTVLVSVIAAVVVARMQKIFKSEARIVLTGGVVPPGLLGSLVGLTPNDKVEKIKQLLQSRTFLSRIVTEFQFANQQNVPLFENALAAVKANIEITTLNSNAFTIGYYAPDPATAQAVTQRLADAVIQTNENERIGKAHGTIDFLDEQGRQTATELENADQSFQEFKRQHFPGMIPGDDTQDGVRSLSTELTTIERSLQSLTASRRALERQLLEEQRRGAARPAVPAPPAPPAKPVVPVPPAMLVAPPVPLTAAGAIPVPQTAVPAVPVRPATVVQLVPAPPRQPTPLENTLAAKKQLLTEYQNKYTDQHKLVVDLKAEIAGLESRVQQARKEEIELEARKEAERKELDKQHEAEEKVRQADLARQQREIADAAERRLKVEEQQRLEAERQRQVELDRQRAERERQIAAAASQVQAPVSPAVDTPGPTDQIAAYEALLNARTEADIKTRMQELDDEIAAAKQQQRTLADRLKLARSILYPSGETGKQMTDLVRAKDAALQNYNTLLARRVSSAMALKVDSSSESGTFEVIDRAYLPLVAVKPNRPLMAVAGCLAGLLVGFAVAFGRDMLDPSVHTEADALAILKLPILAGIPMLEADKKRKQLAERHGFTLVRPGAGPGTFSLDGADEKVRDVLFNPFSIAGEHYRFMNNKLLLMQRERGVKLVLITSAIPGEGKTFSACCLAGILARESGSRVLLIDADLRTGSASQAMGLGADLDGLQQLLRRSRSNLERGSKVSDAGLDTAPPDLDQLVVRCSEVSLDFLPSGTTDETRSQLSSTPELERLLKLAAHNYDWVIIDSPPVLAVADANLLAPLCDATVLVVGSGKTNSALVKEAIDRIGVQRICGLLLNWLRVGHTAYHSYYKRIPLKQVNR